jgi:hypothetical protein
MCRVDDRFKGMAERDSPKAHSVLDELVSVSVPNVATLPANDEKWGLFGILVISFGVGVGTTGNERVTLFLKVP